MLPQAPLSPTSTVASRHHRGFSLVELLVVMAVMSVLLSLGAVVATGVSKAGKFNANVARLSGILDQARHYAIANNTYVWVAFHQAPAGGGRSQDSVGIAVIASKDGTNPVGWSGTTDVPGSALEIVNRLEWMEGASLDPSASISALMDPASRPARSGQPLTGDVKFRLPLPGDNQTVTFDQVAVFTPRGEAAVGPSPIAFADIGLRPAAGVSASHPNVAIIQLSGLTGSQRVYRQ